MQRTLAECLKRRGVIAETDDSDEEEGGSAIIDDTRGSSSRSIHVAHCVHPAVPALDVFVWFFVLFGIAAQKDEAGIYTRVSPRGHGH
jgi:hypothetical protein